MVLANAANQLAIDVNGLAQAKRLARDDPRAAAKGVAQQVEALFLQMVIKAMREATPKEGLFDSGQTRLYQSMYDQQLAQVLSARGSTGLAAVIERQLTRGLNGEQTTSPSSAVAGERAGVKGQSEAAPAPPIAPPGGERESALPVPARGFINRLWSQAREASQATGIPAHFMIAQAALETGWGRAELRFSDGAPTYNLFGIKAGRGWQGAVAEATTTEYVNGVAQKTVERFRAYGSYAEAFRDYANLLTTNPRYAGVLNRQDAAGFARGLQQAGYATDPMYAAKLERIIGGQALRSGMIG